MCTLGDVSQAALRPVRRLFCDGRNFHYVAGVQIVDARDDGVLHGSKSVLISSLILDKANLPGIYRTLRGEIAEKRQAWELCIAISGELLSFAFAVRAGFIHALVGFHQLVL